MRQVIKESPEGITVQKVRSRLRREVTHFPGETVDATQVDAQLADLLAHREAEMTHVEGIPAGPLPDDLWQEASSMQPSARPWALPSPACGGRVGDEGGFPHPPFKWDEDRRAVLRAELDACYARLYGLTEEELRYTLDPADVYGSDFPGETFRVLKEKEIKQYGEYRTKRLVLDAFSNTSSGT